MRDPNSTKDPIDRDCILYQNGFKAGQEHSKSSPETIRAIGELREHNTELFGMVKSIHESIHSEFGIIETLKEIKSNTEKELSEIKGHTARTNGRVGALENWKAGLVVGFSILMFAVPSITWYFINKFDTLRDNVLTHIASDSDAFNRLNK
jgi:hypothetical protein